jgi:transcriptional regulator with XRE-family HTH domain
MPRGQPVSKESLIISANIARCRRAKGMTQGRLARALGFTQGYVSRMEAGEFEIRKEWFDRIVKILEVKSIELLLEKEAMDYDKEITERIARMKADNTEQPTEPADESHSKRQLLAWTNAQGKEFTWYEGDEEPQELQALKRAARQEREEAEREERANMTAELQRDMKSKRNRLHARRRAFKRA